MDKQYLIDIIEKIYTINCKVTDCDECKGELHWCPKAYADDILTGIKLIAGNIKTCEQIIKDKNL